MHVNEGLNSFPNFARLLSLLLARTGRNMYISTLGDGKIVWIFLRRWCASEENSLNKSGGNY